MGVFDMLTEHMVVRIRLIVYVALIVFSFFIFIGVAVMKDRAGNTCPLYYTWPSAPAPVSNCNYPLAIAVIFQLIYTLYRIVILLLLVLGKFTTEMFLFSNIMELVYVLIDVSVFILTFIGACILSAGHNSSDFGKRIDDGWESASRVAQAGAWISTILWLLLAIVGVVYMLRAGKLPFVRSGSSGAAGSGNTGNTGPSAPPIDTPPNYDQSKY